MSEAELKSILCSPASGLMLLNCIDTDKERFSGIKNLVIVGAVDDALQPGARLRIDGIRAGMAAGKLTLTDTAAGKAYPVVCSLTGRQQAILLAGGLLNYTKEHAL